MKHVALLAAIAAALISNQGAKAQSVDAAASKLLGTWKLVSVVREEVPSGTKIDLMGPNPVGFITYGADARMMVLIMRSGRPKPAGDRPTATEAETLFRTMVSYAGSYTISGNEVTHHVDISWNQAWAGTKQVRIFKFDGDRVTLSTPVSPDPMDGKVSVRSLVWEKLK